MGGVNAMNMDLGTEDVAILERLNIIKSNDEYKYNWDIELDSIIQAMYVINDNNNNKEKVDSLSIQNIIKNSNTIGLVLDQTSFYPEAGGQDCDTGILSIQINNEYIDF